MDLDTHGPSGSHGPPHGAGREGVHGDGAEGVGQAGGEEEDLVHVFCACSKVRESWCWLRTRILRFLPVRAQCLSDFELVRLMFPPSKHEPTIIWLLASYLHLVWIELCKREKPLSISAVIGHLKQKYLLHNSGYNWKLDHISFEL